MGTKSPNFRSAILCCIFTLAFYLLPAGLSYSQSDILKYAREIIDTLASSSMHGRGYIQKGDSIAADYIQREFKTHKLRPLGIDFYQYFHFPVNTFPENPGLRYGAGQYLEPGSLFLVKPNSPGTELTKCKVLWFDSVVVSSKKNTRRFKKNIFPDKVIIVDRKGIHGPDQSELMKQAEQNVFNCKAVVIFNNKKLTWTVSQTTASFPTFEVLVPDSLNRILRKEFDHLDLYTANKFIPEYKSQNIIGVIPGTQQHDSFIVFSAHYDHLGRMGKGVYFPGANDNASGCAMLLNLARYYSRNPPRYSILFIAFGGEEAGLVGSKYYTKHPLSPLKRIKFLINMDIMGTGDEGIKVVNATEHKEEFEKLTNINIQKKLLPAIQPRGKAANSDHHFFEEAGVKTFFIYTLGGIKAYHDIYDRPETLPLTKFEEAFKLLVEFTDKLQE